MPELSLHRAENTLEVTFGEHRATVSWADVAPDATTGQRIYDDAVAYGKNLFAKTFVDESLKHALIALQANERLVLVIDDPQVSAIPWEYLRDPDGRLLASRLTLVRSVLEAQPQPSNFTLPLHIIAIPVSPVDDSRVLDTEGEWQRVLAAVRKQSKALTLTRVRPPTLDTLERTLHSERTTIVHFMGHSDSRDGKGLLAFEEAHGHTYLIEAADFADTLAATNIFLVILNSCRSAIAWDWTAFGNIARGLVREGVPYALGMQFVLPDDAALAVSQALYDFLLQGRSVEEAVRRTRRTLEHNTALHNPSWLAGIPVLYTSLRERPAAPLKLSDGQPTIQPDPERLQKTCDLAALPQAAHFVGRSKEISQALDALLASRAANFVALHGLGGIGKTSLARAVAERVGWYYDDRVLAISFETFARLDANDQRIIDETFADRFYNRLARFYELDPTNAKEYPTTTELQQAILQRRTHTRSLLVLDNIETLIDAQKDHSAAKALATFVSRLKEGEGAVLLTSRMVPPPDWGTSRLVEVPGLEDKAGADLFLVLLPADHTHLAPSAARLSLSHRVQGHPLSIRLLAARFSETITDLAIFLQNISTELEQAEQTTPTSLEDPERQKTLYACMDYSVKRLAPEQRKVLDAVSLFQSPFPPEFAVYILDNEEQTPVHLQNLVRLGLLNMHIKTFKEGEITLLDLHAMMRWYLQSQAPRPNMTLRERYGEVYASMVRQAFNNYDKDARLRYLVPQSLPDCEVALQCLPPAGRSAFAYYLATPYLQVGQNRRALALYEQALEIYQELGDRRSVATTQYAIADVLRNSGRLQEAIALYEQALRTYQALEERLSVAVMQHAIADVLQRLGKPQEAMTLYEQALHTKQEVGVVGEVALTQLAIAGLLNQFGEIQEAMSLYERSLHTYQVLKDVRGVAVTQTAIAGILLQLGKHQEAMAIYEHVLCTYKELGDVRGIAMTQCATADLLNHLSKRQEAITLYEEALHMYQELKDIRGVAVTQHAIAEVLRHCGKEQEAMALYEQALQTKQELGDTREVALTQLAIADLLRISGKIQEAMILYEQTLCSSRQLGDVRGTAIVQINFCQLLLQLGEHQRALSMVWQAYTSLNQIGLPNDVQMVESLLLSIKGQVLGSAQFDVLWEQVIHDSQPDWLRDVRVISLNGQDPLSPETLEVVVSNTIAVMKEMKEKQDEWRVTIAEILKQVRSFNRVQDAEFFTAILTVLDGQAYVLPEGHPFSETFNTIQAGIAAGGPQGGNIAVAVSDELMQAVRDFVNADDWEATQQALEAQQVLLFQPVVETLFEQIIARARSAGEQRTVGMLEQHLALLRACKKDGIAEAFKQREQAQEADLPFDAELIPRSIVALLGSPQEKMAYAQYLIEQTNKTTDEQLKALLQVIQLALFSPNLSQLGCDLQGVYRQTWDSIADTVEAGGMDPRTFELIANNTLAVLGPTSNRRSEWRAALIDLRNQATVQGNRNMVALLEAVIGLLDAGGDPTGLGVGLKGIYAQIWQAIIEHLSA